jgi:small acid-soluble spore protein E (minor gamma-type SASP)
MAKKTQAGTNVQHVKNQNAQAAAGQPGQAGQTGQFTTEFASETNAQEVRKKNQQSQTRKGQ